MRPGESIESGIKNVEVLESTSAIWLEARQGIHLSETQNKSSTKTLPTKQIMKTPLTTELTDRRLQRRRWRDTQAW